MSKITITRRLLPNTEKLFRYSVKMNWLYRITFLFGYQYRITFSVIYADTANRKTFSVIYADTANRKSFSAIYADTEMLTKIEYTYMMTGAL